MDNTTPTRRVERIRYEVKRRELTVVRTQRVGAHFVSVTFAGPALADFQTGSFDDHVKVFVPVPGGEPAMRDYTPLHFDRSACELTLEFVLHGDGPAGTWAAGLQAGDRATIGGPRGSMVVPSDYPWVLMVGDATALPAITRRLAELPPGVAVEVLVQVADVADQRPLPSAAQTRVRWFSDTEGLLAAVAAWHPPAGDGFVWGGLEARAAAAVQDLVVTQKGHPKEATRVSAYWKR
jgi:NADPH-dependent ferric siderophore reductase